MSTTTQDTTADKVITEETIVAETGMTLDQLIELAKGEQPKEKRDLELHPATTPQDMMADTEVSFPVAQAAFTIWDLMLIPLEQRVYRKAKKENSVKVGIIPSLEPGEHQIDWVATLRST